MNETVKSLVDVILATFFTGLVAFLFFLIQSYYKEIKRKLNALATAVTELRSIYNANAISTAKDISRIEGSVEAIRKDVKENTQAQYQTIAELKALWRVVDAPERTSDRVNGGN